MSGGPEGPAPTHPSARLVVEEQEQEEGSKGALPRGEQEEGLGEELPDEADEADESRPQVRRGRTRRRPGDGVGSYAFDRRGRIVAVESNSQLPSQHLPGKTPHDTLHYATGDNPKVFVAERCTK